MVYDETPLEYPDHKITFNVYNNSSDKQSGAFTIQNNKPISFFLSILIRQIFIYTTTDK